MRVRTTSWNGWVVAGLLVVCALVILPGTGCKKAANDPFPATGSVAGWAKSGETRNFAAADLWQYIDGGAEQYVKAGVVTTATSDYKYRDHLEAVVDIYTFNDGAGAKTIFESSPVGTGKFVAIGEAGLSYAQSVIFRKGKFLVKIVSYEATPGSQEAMTALAHALEQKL
jgi:hypothetical protein